MIAKSQTPIVWRFQSTWPAKDIFHEYAQDYARRVNEMASGRLRLDVLPAGAVVGAFEMQDAVSTGVLDGGHGVCAYWYGKNKAFSLFGTAPSFGWQANDLLGWFYYGDGQTLYNELIERHPQGQCRRLADRTDADATAGLVQEADHRRRPSCRS